MNSIILRNKDITLADPALKEAVIYGFDDSHTIKHSSNINFPDYSGCLEAINSGEADYTVMPIAVLQHLYMQDYYSNIIPVVDQSKRYLSIAMNKNVDMNLYTVLSKGIVNLQEDQLNAIVSDSTLSVGARAVSLKSLFYSNPVLSAVVIASFVILLGVIFLMHTWFEMQNKIAYTKLKRIEELSKVRSEFLSRMSHEIRTPLNSIVGFSDVLAVGGNTEEEQQTYYQIIKTNSDLLLRLINDILDLSRLEANRVTLTWEECDVVQLCRQVVASVSVSRQSGNQFLFVSDYESFRMTTDIQRMQQVIINLMSNADKFTRKGQITLEFSVNEETEMAVFSVTDTGCGIPKEKQKLVFERFEKLNEYAQGTGLGLSICKLIVHKWKGDIWIDSEYTGGARFMFSHPLKIEKE